jgi:hypothetical protein
MDGCPSRLVMTHVGMSSRAKYVVFYAMDKMSGVQLFDSIDLFDAFHPPNYPRRSVQRHGSPRRALGPATSAPRVTDRL